MSNDFFDYYKLEILPELKRMEEERKRVSKKLFRIIYAILLVIIIIVFTTRMTAFFYLIGFILGPLLGVI